TLGTFSLGNGGTADYDGNMFDLMVTFTVPSGSGSTTADVAGNVHGGDATTPLSVTFSDPVLTFDGFPLTLADLSDIQTGNTYTLTGVITAVPESSTWAMIILGFCGIGFMAYRKTTTIRFV